MGVTIEDVAALANTSTATVSRVINNRPGVTEDTRQRVLALAEKLGYRPNRIAQSLALQRSHVLGFVAADLVSTVYIDFFRRVQHRVEKMGYQVLIADSEQSVEKEKHNLEVMRIHRAEGILIFPVHDWKIHTDIDHFLRMRLQKFPFVVIGKLDEVSVDSVTSDEIETAQQMGRHLTHLGHRRIAFVGYEEQNRPVRERLAGIQRAMREAGTSIPEEFIITLGEGWIADLCSLLRKPNRPTALVIINDVCSLMAHRPIAEMGLRVPEDVSIATFDNGIWTNHLKPSLTTTSENVDEIARVAMDMLFSRIEDNDRPPAQHLVPQEIIIRESTGPCPGI